MVRDVMLSRSLIAIRTASIMHVPTHDPTLAGLGWRTVGDSKFDLLFDELFVSPLDSQILFQFHERLESLRCLKVILRSKPRTW